MFYCTIPQTVDHSPQVGHNQILGGLWARHNQEVGKQYNAPHRHYFQVLLAPNPCHWPCCVVHHHASECLAGRLRNAFWGMTQHDMENGMGHGLAQPRSNFHRIPQLASQPPGHSGPATHCGQRSGSWSFGAPVLLGEEKISEEIRTANNYDLMPAC